MTTQHEAGAIDYAQLRALAQKANGLRDGTTPLGTTAGIEYIAAISPDVVLVLLDERERLRGAIREALAHWWDIELLPIEGYNPHFLELAEKLRAALGEEGE